MKNITFIGKGILSVMITVACVSCNSDPAKENTTDTTALTVDTMQSVVMPADTAKVLPDTMPKRIP